MVEKNKIEKNVKGPELKITGLSDVIALIKEKLNGNDQVVVLIDGPAAAGKSWFSVIFSQIILPMLEDDIIIPSQVNIPIPSKMNRDLSPEVQTKNNILGVDLFYHDRESDVRKRPHLFHWIRMPLLKETMLGVLEKQRRGDETATIEMDAFLHGDGLKEHKFTLDLSGSLIIEGIGAMGLVPTLNELGYSTLNIVVVAEKDTRNHRAGSRGLSRGRSESETLSLLKSVTDPSWDKYGKVVVFNNTDLVVESSMNGMSLSPRDKFNDEEFMELLK